MLLVLIRHGRPEGAAGRCIGSTDLPLAPDGLAAMRALVDPWYASGARSLTGPPARVVTSHLRRAADSARVVGAAWGRPVEIDQRVRELDFGTWDGQPWSAIEETDGERLRTWSARWTEVAPPEGEPVSALADRARDWLSDACASATRGSDEPSTIVVVAHAGWIRAAVSELLGRPIGAMFELPADYAHATIVRVDQRGSEAVALNAPSIP